MKTRKQYTTYIKRCPVCGRIFKSHRQHARYDRPVCRQKISRAMRALGEIHKAAFDKGVMK